MQKLLNVLIGILIFQLPVTVLSQPSIENQTSKLQRNLNQDLIVSNDPNCPNLLQGWSSPDAALDEHNWELVLDTPTGTNIFQEISIQTGLARPSDIRPCDLDSDGDMDILCAVADDEDAIWFENDGNGNFTYHLIADLAVAITQVVGCDIDQDGDIDVIGDDYDTGRIFIWYNDGDENFTQQTISSNFSSIGCVTPEDLDEDGDIDLVGLSFNYSTLAWWENDGNENFTQRSIDTQFSGGICVNVEDIDGDGDWDIAGSASSGRSIHWYENNGSESFTRHTIVTDLAYPRDIFTCDINGDGDMDILSSTWTTNTILIFQNDGNENFSQFTLDSDCPASCTVEAVDLDLDGDLDVIGTSFTGRELSWHENIGNMNFTEHYVSTTYYTPRSAYAADFDDDNDLDIVSCSWTDGDVVWFSNYISTEPLFELVLPINNYFERESNQVALYWTAAVDNDPEDIVTYNVYVTTDQNEWGPPINITPIPQDSVSIVFTGDFHVHYYWKVFASDTNSDGSESEVREFYINGPPEAFTLSYPQDSAVVDSDEVTVIWTTSSDQEADNELLDDSFSYVVEWSPFIDFSSQVGSYTTTDTSYTITDLEEVVMTSEGSGGLLLDELPEDVTIYWRVKARDLYGLETWADPGETGWKFMYYLIDPPDPFSLLTPEDGSICYTGDTTFTWELATEPDLNDDVEHYTLQYSTAMNFSENLITIDNIVGEEFEVTGLGDDTTYYWRVRANDTNSSGTWSSEIWSIVVSIPDPPNEFSLISPEDGSTCFFGDTTLTWEANGDLDEGDEIHYVVWFSRTEDYSILVDSIITTQPEFDVHDLEDEQTYWWKVRAQDTNSSGTWSTESWSINVDIKEAPNTFALYAPSNGSTINSDEAVLTWYPSSDNDPDDDISYVVEWSITPTYDEFASATTADTFYVFTDLIASVESISDEESGSMNQIESLPDDTIIYWRVKALNQYALFTFAIPGEAGWSFNIAIPNQPMPFNLVSPVDSLELDTLAWRFIWEETIDPDPNDTISYQLAISMSDIFDDSLTAYYNPRTDTSFIVPYMADDTDFWWRVLAVDTNTDGTYSDSINFFHTAMPEAPHEFEMIECGMLFTEVADSVDMSICWNRAYDPDPESDELYAIYVDLDEDMANQVLLIDNFSLPATTDTLYTWSGRVALEELPGGDGDDFYFTIHALDNNSEGTWASNVVDTHLSPVIEDPWSGSPIEYEISSLYPNPFNPTLTVVIGLPEISDLTVKVYNVLGQKVAMLSNGGQYSAGYHNFIFNVNDVTSHSSGIYFIHASIPGKLNQVKKIVLMK